MNQRTPGKKEKGILGFWGRSKGPLLIFLMAFYLYVLAGKIEETPTPGQLGPGFWPKALLILLMVSCGIKALEIIFPRPTEAEPGGVESPPPPELDVSKLAVLIALVIGVVAVLDSIGFVLANFFFLLVFLRVSGLKKKLNLVLISALGTVGLIYLFVKVVYLPFPKGRWFFDDLTIFIYRILGII